MSLNEIKEKSKTSIAGKVSQLDDGVYRGIYFKIGVSFYDYSNHILRRYDSGVCGLDSVVTDSHIQTRQSLSFLGKSSPEPWENSYLGKIL